VIQSDITAAMIARVLDLRQVLVAGGCKDTANEAQAAVIANIWSSSYAMVCKCATSNDFREPCIGRTFHWAEDGSQIGATVETYYENQTRSNIIRARHETDEVILYSSMGHLLSNIA
jgi:hypothetical protein